MKYNPFRAKGRYEANKVTTEVTPPHYVYHLDFSGGKYHLDNDNINYRRLNIAKEGLYGKDMGYGGVWVNIYQSCPILWFPISLDLWDWDCVNDLFETEKLLGYYDVWRIDTTKIKNKWYIDPNMHEAEVHDITKVLYTPDSVSGNALQLFHMEIDKDILMDYNAYKLAELKPYRKINEFIRFTHRRKRTYSN
jgi:hypothetical protein